MKRLLFGLLFINSLYADIPCEPLEGYVWEYYWEINSSSVSMNNCPVDFDMCSNNSYYTNEYECYDHQLIFSTDYYWWNRTLTSYTLTLECDLGFTLVGNLCECTQEPQEGWLQYPMEDFSCKAWEDLTSEEQSIYAMQGAPVCNECYAPPYDEHSCLPPKILDTSTVPPRCIDCTTPNTDFPTPADNEKTVLQWQELDDYTSECTTQYSGFVQERTIDCKKEYRCVKTEDKEKCSRDEPISSYISPTAGVFHEDIALVGTNINLHYQSEYLTNDTIAFGWSLNLHHTLDGDYLHLGSGRLLNIASLKSLENNSTIVNLNSERYIFDANNLHTLTKDNYTDKTLYTFTYNSNNSLSKVTDAFGKTTTINRDANNTAISITAPHGQINYLLIDENRDLINISYEDATDYKFTYSEHLMISEIEPNGNEFLHEFDESGKVVRVVDAEQGIWSFSNTTNDIYIETAVNRASGDIITYRDYFLSDGSMVSKTIIASGDTFSSSSTIDGTETVLDKCGVVKTINYQAEKDPITNKSVPSSITTAMPSGLSKTTNYSQIYTFDADTLVKKETTTQTNGATTTTTRDYELSTMTITSPQSRVSTIAYNQETQLPTKIEVESLEPATYLYDELGRVITIEQGFRKSEFTYDTSGNLASATDATEALTQYSYDDKARLITILKPNTTTIEFSYDANGNMKQLHTPSSTVNNFNYNGVNKESSWQTPSGYMTQYFYDKQRRLTQILRPSGKTEDFTYTNGRLVSIETDESNLTLAYSCADKVQSMSTANGETLLFTYDGDLLTRLSHSGTLNQTIDIAYNNDFLPQSIGYAGFIELLDYDKDGLMIQSGEAIIERNITYSYNEELNGTISDANLSGMLLHTSDNGYHEVLHYNTYGELDSSSNTLNAKRVFTQSLAHRDPTGRILSKTEHIGSKTIKYNYTYNTAGRLTKSETVTGNIIVIPAFDGLVIPVLTNKEQHTEHYTYDNNGNRLQATINETTTTASYTLDDKLEVYGDNTYRYDDDGYLVEKITPDGTTAYTYGTRGELISVTTPTKTIEYIHNANNQRVAKKVDGVITEKYLWKDLTTLLAIYNSDDTLKTRFSYAGNRVPYKMTHNNETYYLSYNHLGSLRAIADIDGNIVKEVTYDSFGIILNDSNPDLDINLGFAGGLYDRDTELTRFGYRDYDAHVGKWTAKDPIRFGGGDSNLYGYVLENPVSFVDPFGLNPLENYLNGIVSVPSGLYNLGYQLGRLNGNFGVVEQYYSQEELKNSLNTMQTIYDSEQAQDIFLDACIQHASNNKAFLAGRFTVGPLLGMMSGNPVTGLGISSLAASGDGLSGSQSINEFARKLVLGY